jgi:hypothetical protein
MPLYPGPLGSVPHHCADADSPRLPSLQGDMARLQLAPPLDQPPHLGLEQNLPRRRMT